MSQDHAWLLLESGHAKEAAEAFDRLIKSEPTPKFPWLVNRGLALVAAEQINAAIDSFVEADRLAQRPKPNGIRLLLKIAQSLWLADERERALRTAKEDVELIRTRSTTYTDLSGGVSNGLFLFYSGVTLIDREATEMSIDFLQHLARDTARITAWPGPIGSFVLKQITLEQLLTHASGFGEIKRAELKAKSDIVVRRRMAQTLFYAAAAFRHDGFEARCMEFMEKCSALPNPLELEWYLARAEASHGKSLTTYGDKS